MDTAAQTLSSITGSREWWALGAMVCAACVGLPPVAALCLATFSWVVGPKIASSMATAWLMLPSRTGVVEWLQLLGQFVRQRCSRSRRWFTRVVCGSCMRVVRVLCSGVGSWRQPARSAARRQLGQWQPAHADRARHSDERTVDREVSSTLGSAQRRPHTAALRPRGKASITERNPPAGRVCGLKQGGSPVYHAPGGNTSESAPAISAAVANLTVPTAATTVVAVLAISPTTAVGTAQLATAQLELLERADGLVTAEEIATSSIQSGAVRISQSRVQSRGSPEDGEELERPTDAEAGTGWVFQVPPQQQRTCVNHSAPRVFVPNPAVMSTSEHPMADIVADICTQLSVLADGQAALQHEVLALHTRLDGMEQRRSAAATQPGCGIQGGGGDDPGWDAPGWYSES